MFSKAKRLSILAESIIIKVSTYLVHDTRAAHP